jgi:hypothetical protein
MKKRFIYIIVFIFVSGTAMSQTQEGGFMVGGNIELNTAKNDSKIALTPSVGYFISNNFALGINGNLDYTKIEKSKITTWGVGPFARYYIGSLNFRPFAHADVSFQANKNRNNLETTKYNSKQYFLGAGLAVFLNRNVAVETLMGYRHTTIHNSNSNGGFNLRIGFQVYLLKQKDESLKFNNGGQ